MTNCFSCTYKIVFLIHVIKYKFRINFSVICSKIKEPC